MTATCPCSRTYHVRFRRAGIDDEGPVHIGSPPQQLDGDVAFDTPIDTLGGGFDLPVLWEAGVGNEGVILDAGVLLQLNRKP